MKLFGRISFLLTFVLATTVFSAAQEPQIAQNVADRISPSQNVKTSGEKVKDQITPSSSLARVGVQTALPLPLSLGDAIRKALEGNNDIEVSRDDVRFQETTLRSLLGSYDPVFTVNPNYTRNHTTGQAGTNDFRVNSDISGIVRPGGGTYRGFFNNTRTENAFAQAQVSSGSIGSSSSAIYSSSLGFSYTQPLLRNFNTDSTRRLIKIARKQLQQSDADFRRTTIETIARVQQAYWDLVFALRDQQNRVANVDLAKENLRQIEAKIEAGSAAPLEKYEVATELANRETDLLLATQQVSIMENSLKQLLIKEPASAEWSQTYVPVDKPVISSEPVDFDAAMKDAMDNRYELRRLKLQAEVNAVDLAYFRNQTRPQIDFNTTFSLNGLSRGGQVSNTSLFVPLISRDATSILTNPSSFLLHQIDPNGTLTVPTVEIPPTSAFLVGGFRRSLANMFRADAPNYSFGVTISFPFRNRTARANLAGAKVQEEQIAAQTRSQEQVVIVEVRNAVQAVETARQRVLTATNARENAEKQLEGERKLYDAGKSTTFLLFQRENTLTNARNAEIRAQTDYNKAVSDLQKATSTTFRVNNIEVESPTDNNK